MEPRALANLNGTVIPSSELSNSPHGDSTENISPTKEFLNLSSPVSSSSSQGSPSVSIINVPTHTTVQTPLKAISESSNTDFTTPSAFAPYSEEDFNAGSPTTPYYLSRGAELVQQTCPPKQMRELLFPVNGKIEDHPNEEVKRKLWEARRKSLQFAPKVGSRLGPNGGKRDGE